MRATLPAWVDDDPDSHDVDDCSGGDATTATDAHRFHVYTQLTITCVPSAVHRAQSEPKPSKPRALRPRAQRKHPGQVAIDFDEVERCLSGKRHDAAKPIQHAKDGWAMVLQNPLRMYVPKLWGTRESVIEAIYEMASPDWWRLYDPRCLLDAAEVDIRKMKGSVND